jgi:hypothetical protein
VGGQVGQPGRPDHKVVIGASSGADELQVGSDCELHLPADPFSPYSSVGVKDGDALS